MTTTAAPTGTTTTEPDDAATTEAHAILLAAANQALQHVGRAVPLGRLLSDASALRVNARERLVDLRYGGRSTAPPGSPPRPTATCGSCATGRAPPPARP